MSRCIVFDHTTAAAVQSHTGMRTEIRAAGDDPGSILESALQTRTALAIVPAARPGKVLLMRLRHQRRPASVRAPSDRLAPSGFLGLTDSIDMDSEPEQPKKWWQKILG